MPHLLKKPEEPAGKMRHSLRFRLKNKIPPNRPVSIKEGIMKLPSDCWNAHEDKGGFKFVDAQRERNILDGDTSCKHYEKTRANLQKQLDYFTLFIRRYSTTRGKPRKIILENRGNYSMVYFVMKGGVLKKVFEQNVFEKDIDGRRRWMNDRFCCYFEGGKFYKSRDVQ